MQVHSDIAVTENNPDSTQLQEHPHPDKDVLFFEDAPDMFFGLTNEGKYYVKGGPSTRRIVDFSDIENSVSILPTGNSGNPMSKHYNDQAEIYNKGQFRKMKMNKKEIEASSRKLVFKLKSK